MQTGYLKGAPIKNQRRWQESASSDMEAAGCMVIDVATILDTERAQRRRNRQWERVSGERVWLMDVARPVPMLPSCPWVKIGGE